MIVNGAAIHRSRKRLILLMCAVGFVILTAAAVAWKGASDEFGLVRLATSPLLPDLAMGPITDVGVGTTASGGERLRFAATIVNIGDGPLLVQAVRSWPWTDDWAVRQRINERTGGFTETLTPATLVFGGDGHDHWHVKNVEAHELLSSSGLVLGRLVKQGFCFFDTDGYRLELAAAPSRPHWGSRGCAGKFDARVRMGLSIGWGDKYPWHLLDERIDITDVPDGQYRIRQIADPGQVFQESDETNNQTTLEVELFTRDDGLRDVRTIAAGPPP